MCFPVEMGTRGFICQSTWRMPGVVGVKGRRREVTKSTSGVVWRNGSVRRLGTKRSRVRVRTCPQLPVSHIHKESHRGGREIIPMALGQEHRWREESEEPWLAVFGQHCCTAFLCGSCYRGRNPRGQKETAEKAKEQ
ncbi:hypothetical protein Bbelb_163460 [Branchiostoma belcheri]|nr:hypothetical protein Bbelb_163460 [Branchiostoma belcheri]